MFFCVSLVILLDWRVVFVDEEYGNLKTASTTEDEASEGFRLAGLTHKAVSLSKSALIRCPARGCE